MGQVIRPNETIDGDSRANRVMTVDTTGAYVPPGGGGLTDAQLRATAVPVSGAFYQATQPISGTVTANAGTNLNTSALALEAGNLASVKTNTDKIPSLGQALAAASAPVVLTAAQLTTLTPPAALTNYATETGGNLATIAGKDFATQTTLALIKAKTDNIPALGQSTMVGSSPVTLASNQSAIPVTGTFWQATQPVSGTVTINAIPAGTNNIGDVDVLTLPVAFNTGIRSATTQRVTIATDDSVPVTGTFYQATQPVSGTFWQATQPVSASSLPLPTGAATETTLSSLLTELGQKTEPANTQITKEVRSGTPGQSSVSVLTSSTTVLAANASRLGATIYNESGAIVFLKLGATASATSYSIQVAIGGYYEIPFGYTGVIDGITALTTAIVRVTELAS